MHTDKLLFYIQINMHGPMNNDEYIMLISHMPISHQLNMFDKRMHPSSTQAHFHSPPTGPNFRISPNETMGPS